MMGRQGAAPRRSPAFAIGVVLLMTVLAGCGGSAGPSVEELQHHVAEIQVSAQQSEVSAVRWQAVAIVLGIVGILIGCAIGSKARAKSDGS